MQFRIFLWVIAKMAWVVIAGVLAAILLGHRGFVPTFILFVCTKPDHGNLQDVKLVYFC